ncbi:hypothetical protein AB833_30820 [Chromatiales bacterium (ex Bugula neritina AB1)]|nr:hypothetical protein AB833_30820 [Chromatiales bacterium (ex Bugula neritina AB1)]
MSHTSEVLYVEDCEETVELFRLCLRRYCTDTAITLDVACTVSDAIERFTTERHVAALIDWNLPDGEGTEVAEYIHQFHKALPIIFLSAMFTDQHLLVAERYNPKACLIKDYSKNFVDIIIQHIHPDVV